MSAAPWALVPSGASGVGLPRVSRLARSSSRWPAKKAPILLVGRNAGRDAGSRRLVSPPAVAAGASGENLEISSGKDSEGSGSLGETLAVFTVELGLMAMGIVDTLMVGHVGEAALAAASLGGTATWLVIITTMGFVGSLDPLTSQAHGAGDAQAVINYLRYGVRAAVILAIFGSFVMNGALWVFTLCGQPPAHAAAAAHYCHTEAWGILPILLFQTFRLSLAGTNKFSALVWAIACANAVNVALNKVFIDGAFVPSVLGFPAFMIEAHGLHGAAWATVASRWILFTLLVRFARKPLAERHALTSVRLALASNPFGRAAREDWRGAWEVLRRGWAIGAQMFVEFGAFAGMSLIAGRCGTVHAAGHAIIQCLTDVSYVIPLGVGVMGSIKVGQNVGAGSTDGARAAARLAMMRGAVGVAVNAFIFMVFGDKICWWFTNEKTVHDCALAALPVVALYQAADGLRVVGAGCLRGVGRLGAALISDVIGFWVLGVPIGAYLALGPPNMGMHGLWQGFCFGVVAVMTPIVLKAWGVGGAEEKPLASVEKDKGIA